MKKEHIEMIENTIKIATKELDSAIVRKGESLSFHDIEILTGTIKTLYELLYKN